MTRVRRGISSLVLVGSIIFRKPVASTRANFIMLCRLLYLIQSCFYNLFDFQFPGGSRGSPTFSSQETYWVPVSAVHGRVRGMPTLFSFMILTLTQNFSHFIP